MKPCVEPLPVSVSVCLLGSTARIEDMRRDIGVAQHTNGTTNGADELQLLELIDEGTYGKVFKGLSTAMWRHVCIHVFTCVFTWTYKC